jgi:hypothetical protein
MKHTRAAGSCLVVGYAKGLQLALSAFIRKPIRDAHFVDRARILFGKPTVNTSSVKQMQAG